MPANQSGTSGLYIVQKVDSYSRDKENTKSRENKTIFLCLSPFAIVQGPLSFVPLAEDWELLSAMISQSFGIHKASAQCERDSSAHNIVLSHRKVLSAVFMWRIFLILFLFTLFCRKMVALLLAFRGCFSHFCSINSIAMKYVGHLQWNI